VFLLTSITKLLTALTAMSLVETGELALESPLSAVVPEFAAAGKGAVTLGHILSHTSGIRGDAIDTAEQYRPGWTGRDHLAVALAAPATDPPGARVEYSSSPFWAVAAACERVTGRPYPDHFNGFFADRGAVGLGYVLERQPPADLVYPGNPDLVPLAEQARLVAYPAGGALGTAEQLLTIGEWFVRSPNAGRVGLSARTRAAMTTPRTVGISGPREPDAPDSGTERGLGWGIGGPGSARPDNLLFHRGVSGTALWVDRRSSTTAVFLSSCWFLPRKFFALLTDLLFAPHRDSSDHTAQNSSIEGGP
jgi:CubicO group peptidase (beta-lactamase class C family)